MNTLRNVCAAFLVLAGMTGAFAQTTTPPADATTASKPTATAPGTVTDRKVTPPLAGANSFTETQAADRIRGAGFGDVKNLKKDDQGIWRGDAQKNGQTVQVSLDFRGNIVQK